MVGRQCPFCNGRKLTYTFGRRTPLAAVKCEKCGAIGPSVEASEYESLADMKARAMDRWNDRPGDAKRPLETEDGKTVCKHCGREFEQNRLGRRREFCTDQCRKSYNDQLKRVRNRRTVR